MQHNYRKYLSPILIIILSFLLPAPALIGQTKTSENTSKVDETINIVDISKQSSEAILTARQIKERLISQKVLLKKKREIDSLVNNIDAQIKKDKKVDLAAEGLRKLETSLIFLQQEKSLLKSKKNGINAILDNLVENKNILSASFEHWKNVKQTIKGKKLGKTIEKSVDEVLSALNKTLLTVTRLTNITMGMVREISALELEINTRVSYINKVMHQKQGELLSAKLPSFFTLDYFDKKNWDLTGPILQFYMVDLKNLKNYLNANFGILVFHILLIIALIIVFIRLSKTPIPLEIGEGLPYKKRLKQLLSRPISTALIIGIFSSVILYHNSPLVFRDIMLLLIIGPMTVLLKAIFDTQFRIYIYALAVVSVSMIVYAYLPANNVHSRFLLLFIGLVDLFSVLHFTFRHNAKVAPTKKLERLILFLSYGIMAMIFVGLAGNIFGKVMLARYLLFSISKIVVVLFLVIVTAVMVNGISVIFITSKSASRSNFIRKNKRNLIKKIPRMLNFIALIILGHYVLMILGWENIVFSSVDEWLSREYSLGSITFSWGRFFIFIFIIWFSIFLARIVRDVLEEDLLTKFKMEEGLPHTIAMMARYALITIGIILSFSALGIPMSDLAIMFSAFGVGIGFGLQSIFNNLVSGFILLFERPIKIGDTIEVGDLVGTVRSIGIRASNIRTFDGAEIIVPNGNLISNEVVNWTLSDKRRRIEIMVSVSYDVNPDFVREVLLKLLQKHEDVVSDPKPGVYFIEFGNSGLVFRILFWTNHFEKWYSIRSKIMYEVFDTLKAAGIEIPYNQLDLHLRSIDKEVNFKTTNI